MRQRYSSVGSFIENHKELARSAFLAVAINIPILLVAAFASWGLIHGGLLGALILFIPFLPSLLARLCFEPFFPGLFQSDIVSIAFIVVTQFFGWFVGILAFRRWYSRREESKREAWMKALARPSRSDKEDVT